jgi:hypothetical protein
VLVSGPKLVGGWRGLRQKYQEIFIVEKGNLDFGYGSTAYLEPFPPQKLSLYHFCSVRNNILNLTQLAAYQLSRNAEWMDGRHHQI